MMDYITIPVEKLSPDTFTRLVEDFVCREGTDYGHNDYSMSDKVTQVKAQIQRGHALIVFDPNSSSCSIVKKDQI